MSSSVPIPPRQRRRKAAESSWSSSSSSSSPASRSSLEISSPSPSSSSKGKAPVLDSSPALPTERISARRPSLLGSSLSKVSHTVINLGQDDGPPQLVSCVKSSQGFDWNQELFLPSYAERDAHDLEHKPDPVEEIILTDEEAAAMLPQ